MKKNREINLAGLRRIRLGSRKSKVTKKGFALKRGGGKSFADFCSSMPDILAARDIRMAAEAVVRARKKGKKVILGMGAHPIKCGISPVIIELIEKGVICGIAANGAVLVHDFEVAYSGKTSEDVAEGLADGSFGMSFETGKFLNEAINEGVRSGLGLGESAGRWIIDNCAGGGAASLFAACSRFGIPATAHVALGTDIIHGHPEADGALTGEGSLRDFRIFAESLKGLHGGGVFINLGSSVIIPEVFLKALSVSRNIYGKPVGFLTVNMDMITHYRPMENVLKRPHAGSGGRGINITGHHEIMFPLLGWMILEKMRAKRA